MRRWRFGMVTVLAAALVSLAGPRATHGPTPAPAPRDADADTDADGDADAEATNGLDAQRWQRLILQDEHGEVAPRSHLHALQQREALQGRRLPQPALAGVTRGSWQWIGPTNYSGRIRSLVVHPVRTTHLLVGSASGGVWKSIDGGQTWRAINNFLASLEIRSLVIHPGNPEVVYAGTGEFSGIGVLRSSDFGESWQQLAGTEVMGQVRRLAMSSTGVLFAAAEAGVYRVPDAGAPVRVIPYGGFDVEVSPTNPQVVLAAVSVPVGALSEAHVARSVDGGATWAPSTGVGFTDAYSNTRMEVAFAPSNPQVAYALSGEQGGKLYRSADGGATFALRFQGVIQGNAGLVTAQSFHNMALWVNPLDPESLFAGGVSMWKSATGGLSWTGQGCPSCFVYDPVTQTYNNLASGGPVDYHLVVSAPGFNNATNRTVYVAFDQGVLRVPDIGQDAAQVLNPGLGTMQFYAATGDPATGRVLTGSQDTGVHVLGPTLPGPGRILSAGDGGPGAFDTTNGDRVFLTTQYLDLTRRSLTPSGEYTDLKRCTDPDPFRLPDACAHTSNFIAPFVMDPSAPTRLYAGGLRLWRTNNALDTVSSGAGPQWQDLALPGGTASNNVSAIAVAPLDANIVWVARNSGAVYRTATATAPLPQWSQLGQGILPARYVTNITIWPHDPRVVYVTFGGFATNNLNIWRSTDSGATWQVLSGSGAGALPATPVRKLLVHPSPQGGHWLYAATEIGLFTSEDGGASWGVPSDGPSSARIYDMFWMGSTLYVATHGRSLWRATVPATPPPPPPPPGVPGAPTALHAAVSGSTVTLSWLPAAGSAATGFVLDAGTAPGATSIGSFATGSSSPVYVILNVPTGTYYVRVRAQNTAGSSGPSNEAAVAVGGCAAPAAPAALQASVNGGAVTFTWTAVAGMSYQLQAGTGPGLANLGTLPVGPGPSYGVAPPPGTYFVRLVGQNGCGTSGPSNEVSVSITPPQAPGPPGGVTATIGAGRTVSLAWSAPPTGGTPTGYVFEAGSVSGAANLAIVPLGPQVAFVAPSVPPGVYFVRVRAVNAAGTSAPGPESVVTVP